MNADELIGWVPTRIVWHGSDPAVEWSHLGDRRFAEPFFEQTVRRCRQRREMSIDTLREREPHPGIAPTGFVFHMSRCGSTLISQMLASRREHIVISEADPIDAVLRARLRHPGVSDDQRTTWLQGLVNAFGQPREGGEHRLFVKFDSWSVVDLPLIHAAFPDVPWVFVYRRPDEVLASHARERGSQMVPGVLEAALLGIDPASVAVHALDEYAAQVLSAICNSAVRHHARGRGMFVNYTELPSAVWTRLGAHFDMTLSVDDIACMQEVTTRHAKRPYEPYDAEPDVVHGSIPPHLRELAARWVGPSYAELEALRR